MTIKISDKDYEAAIQRGLEELNNPHAVSAKYNSDENLITIEFNTKVVVIINPQEVDILKNLSKFELSNMYLTPGGYGLIFGDDADSLAVSLPGLLAEILPDYPMPERNKKLKR